MALYARANLVSTYTDWVPYLNRLEMKKRS